MDLAGLYYVLSSAPNIVPSVALRSIGLEKNDYMVLVLVSEYCRTLGAGIHLMNGGR